MSADPEVTQNLKDDKKHIDPSKIFGVRHVQCLLLFLAMLLGYAMRVDLSVGIVAMTDPGNTSNVWYDWSVATQSIVLSSFFWGYLFLQVPGGELARRFGGKLLITICIGVNGIVTLFIPLGAKLGGWQVICVCRVIQGLTQGFLFPSAHSLLGKWAPLEEKSRLTTLIYAGCQLGTAIELMVAGFLSASPWGWPTIFYSLGAVSLLWCALYMWLGSDSPHTSNLVSEAERHYIQSSLGHIGEPKKYSTPWKAIFTSLPFWSLIIAHCGQNWGFWTLLTEMPSYMKKVLSVEIQANGVMSALPYLAMYLLSFPLGYLSDLAIRREWVSTTAARKISNSIGHWGPALALLGLSYAPVGDVTVAVIMLTVTVALNAGHFTGYLMVHIDMAPNFAGTLMGITNGIANLVSICAPLAVGLILKDETDATEWRTVFFLSSGIYIAGNLFFVVFGTSERQAWNDPDTSPDVHLESASPESKEGLGVRHLQCFLLFLAQFIAFALRVNMSVAVVAMTDPDAENTFDWSVQIQSVILSSFFWGYIVLQIPGGVMSAKFGAKVLLLIAMGVNSLATFAIPLGAHIGGWQLLCACRVLQGLTQGFLYPSMHFLIGKWVPLEEKGRLNALIYAGSQFGTATQMIAAGYIASAWGWQTIFYSTGVLCLAWTVLYYFLGSNNPQESKMITLEERAYIQNSLGQVGGHVKYPTPWKDIWTSLPFWALIIVHCGQNWGYWTLLTEMPSYMKQVLGVDIKATGYLSAMPYIAIYILSFPMGYIADLAVTKNWLSVTAVRKVSNSIAHWGPAIALIGLSYAPAGDLTAAVILLTITVGLNAGQYTGFMLVHIDMAPNFAGQLMGITNCLANIVSLIAPLAVGFILEDETSAYEWRKVFFISAAIYFVVNLFYVIFGSSKTQSWNEPKSNSNASTETATVGEKTEGSHHI